MKNDKLRQFLQQEAKPMAGWAEFKDGILNADREEQRYRFRIAAKILEYISDKGLTQKAFAEQIGCKPQYLGRVLKGKQDLRLSTILKIQRAMDCKLVSIAEEDFVEAEQPAAKEVKVAFGQEIVFQRIVLTEYHSAKPSRRASTQFFTSASYMLPEIKELSYQPLTVDKRAFVAANDVNKIPEVLVNA